jgi:phosphoketolase
MSRYHLASRALEHCSLPPGRVKELVADLNRRESEAVQYTRERFEDRPEERDWKWSD